MIVAGRRQKPQVPESSVTARVGIGLLETRGYGLEVELHVCLPGMTRADSERLVELAHQVCHYSNATRGNIDVRILLEEPPL